MYFWTRLPASVITPATSSTSAPYERHSSTIDGGVSRGMATNTGSPARGAYAASAQPALPAVGAARLFAPRFAAIVTAAAMPRDLNDRVGFFDSSLMNRFGVDREDNIGVEPSPIEITASFSSIGSTSA